MPLPFVEIQIVAVATLINVSVANKSCKVALKTLWNVSLCLKYNISDQARSQDLEKGGGFFERVRKVQTTLIQIFIGLESVWHGLSENWDKISRKFKRFFSPKTGGLQKKRSLPKLSLISRPKLQKKRSSPKLSLIFRPNSKIQMLFHTASQHLLHDFGTQFPLGGGLFSIFYQKSS